MNNNPPMSVPGTISPDSLRQKADILETNLFKTISKQNNPVVLRFQIDRKTSPEPVIFKALVQLFPRLNLRAPKILIFIKRLLNQHIKPDENIKVQRNILDLSREKNSQFAHLSISLQAVVSEKALAVEMAGTAPVPGKDGDIDKAFFDHDHCPGIIKSDGAIDFREINKYPIVKKGDNLFHIIPPVQGKVGMQYDGKIIPVEKTTPMDITLRDGVERIENSGTDKTSRGYFIRATRTGVVVLTRKEDRITGIEVRDALYIKRLDYSTGNIGTRFICPISMTIDTICAGFKIRAKGSVAVRELDGGNVETEDTAVAHTVHPDSRIRARKDILVNFSRRSSLTAIEGQITVNDELTDTHADGKSITFENANGIVSGSTLDAQTLTLKNLHFNGENQIHFGRRLFSEKKELMEARRQLKEENQARETEAADIQHELQNDLRLLAKTLKTHRLLRDNLKTLIIAAQTMEYTTLYQELESIAASMNTKEVISIKKHLDRLKEIPEEIKKTETESAKLLDRLVAIDKEISEMTLAIEGSIRRAGTLKIFVPDAKDEEPSLVIESKSDRDTRAKIKGEYSPVQGFQLTQF